MGSNIFYLIALLTLNSAGKSHRYYPQRVQLYAFDTSRQVKLTIEPYILGLNVGAAYSLNDHLAIAAGAHGNYSHIINISNSQIGNDKSFGIAYNAGIGYFIKVNDHHSFDVFVQYEHEHTKFYPERYTYNNINYTSTVNFGGGISNFDSVVNLKYYIISLQPSYYYQSDKGYKLGFGCRVSDILTNPITYDTTETEIEAVRKYKSGDILVTPCISFSFSKLSQLKFEVSYSFNISNFIKNGSASNIVNNQFDYFPFLASIAISPNFTKASKNK